jgi:caspase domain-containing protein
MIFARTVCTLLIFMISFSVCSQSLYHIQYNFRTPGDSTTYHAFLVRFDDGTGLLRVRYTTPVAQDAVVETDLDEDFVEDTNSLILKSTNQRFIVGDDKIKFTAPVFLFKINPATGFFDPAGIVASAQNLQMPASTFFTAELIERAALSRDFVLQFFSPDEEFYLSLFNNATRGLTSLEKSVRLHLLVVADTLDKEIGSSCAKDMKRMVETFGALTSYLGIKFLPKTISGKEYSKQNVQTAVNNLKPSPNDIVVFYYSGHGFRTPENLRRFPNLKLKNFRNLRQNFRDSVSWIKKDRQDNITYSLNIEDIFNSIKKKGARFNLVMSDCCNNDIFSVNAKGSKPGKTKGSGIEWSEDNVRTLFLNRNPMSVLATAAATGQKATSNDDFGGFFSYYFKTAMENYSSKLKNNVSWDVILQDAQKLTTVKARHTYCDKPYVPANICQQNPDYKIVFGK